MHHKPLPSPSMLRQLSLFDTGGDVWWPGTSTARGEQPQCYLLFLGLFPDPPDARRIDAAARALRSRFGLPGGGMTWDRLHVTLHAVAGYLGAVPRGPLEAALHAAGGIHAPRMPLSFERLLRFAGSGAVVLRCTAACDAAIARLRVLLSAALHRHGLRPAPSATPHMTLAYVRRRPVPEQPIAPIGWTASRYALILSHQGRGHHEWIGEWPLG